MTTYNGTPGDDSINGSSGDDLIYGLEGNDTLNGLAGQDVLNASAASFVVLLGGFGGLIAAQSRTRLLLFRGPRRRLTKKRIAPRRCASSV